MKILLNNEPVILPEEVKTIADFTLWKEIKPLGTAIAVNGKVIPQSQWESSLIKDDESIIVITAAFGG